VTRKKTECSVGGLGEKRKREMPVVPRIAIFAAGKGRKKENTGKEKTQ